MKTDDNDVEHAHIDAIEPNGTFHMTRLRNGRLEHGRAWAPKEGQAIPPGCEVLEIEMAGHGPCCNVKSLGRVGPSRANSKAYREGWNSIWGKN